MTSLLFAIAAQQAQLRDLHIPAMPLEKAVARLEAIYGSPMTISTRLKDKIIVIEAQQVSEEDVRNQLAKLLDGTWEHKDSGWHLGQSAEEQRRASRRAFDTRLKLATEMIQARRKSLESLSRYDPAILSPIRKRLDDAGPSFFGIHGDEYADPAQRLMTRVLLKLGPVKIAEVESDKRVVFSLRPNKMQSRLDIDISKEIDLYRRELAAWNSSQSKPKDDQDATNTTMPDQVANILFAVYSSDNAPCDIRLYLLPGDLTLPHLEVQASSFEAVLDQLTEEDFAPKTPKTFALSEEARDYSRFLQGGWNALAPSVRKTRIDEFANPVTRDPLSYGFTSAIINDARILDKNIIALGGDNWIRTTTSILADLKTPKAAEKIFGKLIEEEGKWIRLDPSVLGDITMSRYGIKSVIDHVRATRAMSLFDKATLAALAPRGMANSVIDDLVNGFADERAPDPGDNDALRTLGLLQPSEFNQAASPQGIRFGMLNAELKQHLISCVYDNESCSLARSPSSRIDPKSFLCQEATYLVPTGVPNQALLRLYDTPSETIQTSQVVKGQRMTLTPEGWGTVMYQLDHPKAQPDDWFKTFDPKALLYVVVTHGYTIDLSINDDCHWFSELAWSESDTQHPFAISDMPERFRAEIRKGYEAEALRIKKEEQSKKGGGGLSPFRVL
ncbi:MAG: hypothetical protein JST12_01720 [Armatimonadetes bacterium]|nr:hypothetical protein [Armatimonadota bacterium]